MRYRKGGESAGDTIGDFVPLQASAGRHNVEDMMNDETFNLSMRKFLKMVGVSSQHEIEKAVAVAISNNALAGNETLPATMTLEIASIKLRVKFDGDIVLE